TESERAAAGHRTGRRSAEPRHRICPRNALRGTLHVNSVARWSFCTHANARRTGDRLGLSLRVLRSPAAAGLDARRRPGPASPALVPEAQSRCELAAWHRDSVWMLVEAPARLKPQAGRACANANAGGNGEGRSYKLLSIVAVEPAEESRCKTYVGSHILRGQLGLDAE